jgi:hypothetical protein
MFSPMTAEATGRAMERKARISIRTESMPRALEAFREATPTTGRG